MAIVFNVDNICPMCGSYNHVLLFDGEVDGLERYTNENKRVYLQEAFPQTEADVREFIKTGYCGKCQKKIFGYASGRIRAGEMTVFLCYTVTDMVMVHLQCLLHPKNTIWIG